MTNRANVFIIIPHPIKWIRANVLFESNWIQHVIPLWFQTPRFFIATLIKQSLSHMKPTIKIEDRILYWKRALPEIDDIETVSN